MSLYTLLKPLGPSGFGARSTAEEVTEGLDLTGRTILLTGCTSGLGQEALRVLTRRGALVVATGRTLEGARAACERAGGSTRPLACELTDPASIQRCIAGIEQAGLTLDAIICNAGIMAVPGLRLAHGYELQFFTNHVGHFMLVTGLLDRLGDRGRVVVVSSAAHRVVTRAGIDFDNLDGSRFYNPWMAYGRAKLANLLFAKELARRFAGTARTANAVHPGIIGTRLVRHSGPAALVYALGRPFIQKSIAQGAATEVFVAVHPAAAGMSGLYFADVNVARASALADDATLARRLWDVSEEIVSRACRN